MTRRRQLAVLVSAFASVLLGSVATAQTVRTGPVIRSALGEHPAPGTTLSPLVQGTANAKTLGAPAPPFPKRPAKTVRRTQNAYGSTTALTIVSTTPACVQNGLVYQSTCTVTVQGDTLPSTTDVYRNYVQAPNVASPATIDSTYKVTTVGGNEPAADVVTDVALTVQGTWIFGTLDTTKNTWASVTYVDVGTPVLFDTYADAQLSNAEEHFIANGSTTIYVAATGLTPTDSYVYLVENTSDNGKCVWTAPGGGSTTYSASDPLCNPTTPAGQNPVSGSFVAAWKPTISAGLPVGSYMISLYDQTTATRVAQRAISLESSAAGITVGVQFTTTGNAAGTTSMVGTESVPRLAVNCFATACPEDDANVTGGTAQFDATGLTKSHSYVLTTFNPQGQVAARYAFTTTATQTSLAYGTTSYALPSTAYPLSSEYGGNVWTTALYDAGTSATVASQAWQLLGYSLNATWDATQTSSLTIPTGSPTDTEQIDFTNNGNIVYGSGNADSIAQIVLVSNDGFFAGPSLACNSTTVTDSADHSWTCAVTTTGGVGGNNYTMTLTAPANTGLPPGGTLDVPVTVSDATQGTGCNFIGLQCQFSIEILPLHGTGLSSENSTGVADTLQVATNGSSYTGTFNLALLGSRNGGTSSVDQLLPGFTPWADTAANLVGVYPGTAAPILYASGQPFASPGGTNVMAFAVSNTNTGGNTYSQFAITFPTAISASQVTLDTSYTETGITSAAATLGCGATTGLPANTICINPTTALSTTNGNFTYNGKNYDVFILDVPQPSSSFTFSNGAIGALITGASGDYAGAAYTLTPDASTRTVYAPSSTMYGSGTIAAYSLDYGKILTNVTPSQLGTGQTNSVTLQVQNTSLGSDANPDWIDGVLLEIPTPSSGGIVSAASPQDASLTPIGWQDLGNGAFTATASGVTYYYYGLCGNQFSGSAGHYGGSALPDRIDGVTYGADTPWSQRCTQAQAQQALEPGQTFSVPLTVTTTSTGGTWTGYVFAHGANGNGWSYGTKFSVTVAAGTSASSGFTNVGPYTTGSNIPIVTPGSAPQTGGGVLNSYVYAITNTGTTNITAASIAIPNTSTSGYVPSSLPTLYSTSSTVSLSYSGGHGSSGCSVGTYTNPTAGANGTLALTGCTLKPGDTVSVQFGMTMPSAVNQTFSFPATVTGTTSPAAQPAWTNANTLTITAAASLAVQGNTSMSCAGTGGDSGWSASSTQVAFGNVAGNSSVICNDAVLVSVYTDVTSPSNWALYASIDSNPATTGVTNTNEALIETDGSAGSWSVPGVGTVTNACASLASCLGTSAYTVIPTTTGTAGFEIAQTNGGAPSQSAPFYFMTNLQIAAGSETPGNQTHTLTFTWVSY